MADKALLRFRRMWAALIAGLRSGARLLGGVGRADDARRASDWDVAIHGYARYLRHSPRDLGIRIRLGKTFLSAGRLDEAEALFSDAAASRPDKLELPILLADVRAVRAASVPLTAYGRFRRDLVIPAPPALAPASPPTHVTVLVDAGGASEAAINHTLESLWASRVVPNDVVVWTDGTRSTLQAMEQSAVQSKATLLMDAGVILEPHALGWLLHAADVTGATTVYGDDDRCSISNGGVTDWSDPAFYAAPHPLDMNSMPRVPVAVLLMTPPEDLSQPINRRRQLMAAFKAGYVAHVPLLLTTAVNTAVPQNPSVIPTVVTDAGDKARDRIRVIIPTRDEATVLAVMIESLVSMAADTSRFEIIVVDNGSRERKTQRLLDNLQRAGRIKVLRVDEPFNWSRLNNLAAVDAQADILLFANNDMEMLTPHWDDHLRQALAQPDVGVVGARLVYPDGNLQHAGMAFGALNTGPVHEGLGAASTEVGPLARWRRSRPTTAVTGAFMGVRRQIFEDAGGFNTEDFAIGCNDIDFCLRVRALGLTVLYVADLELVHRESHSRGHDETPARIQRAEGERVALTRLWGKAVQFDPARNPHWVSHETRVFHGLRQPEPAVVEDWIVESPHAWTRLKPGARTPDDQATGPTPKD